MKNKIKFYTSAMRAGFECGKSGKYESRKEARAEYKFDNEELKEDFNEWYKIGKKLKSQ